MMQYALGPIAIIICIIVFIYFILQIRRQQKKLADLQNINYNLETSQKKLLGEIEKKTNDLQNLSKDISSRSNDLYQIKSEIFHQDNLIKEMTARNEELVSYYQNLKKSYDENKEQLRAQCEQELQKISDEYKDKYLVLQKEFAEQFKEDNQLKIKASQELSDHLASLKSNVDLAVAQAKAHSEEKNFNNFHRLQLSDEALVDIRELEELMPRLSNEANGAIAKVIWKVYYEKPYSDLCGRVVGNSKKTGIYRITNINNSMCYVGQAVDIAERWKQHIKRALNAEPRTQNKLYPAMYKEGIDNFTFEILEECSPTVLNEREDYWQDFYQAKEYGYSIK